MKLKTTVHGLAITILLTGCLQTNPLEKYPPEKIAKFVKQHGNLAITRCSSIWAHPESANATVLSDCDPTATHIANLLNEGGFGPGISSANIRSAPIWTHYEKLLEAQRKKGEEDLKKVFDWKK